MAWTDIDLYKATQLIDATALDALKGNIEYLHLPNNATYHHPGTGANYTVTGELGQDLDATNFNLSITTSGGPVMAGMYGQWKSPGTGISIRVNIIIDDSVSHVGRNLYHNYAQEIKDFSTNGGARGWIQVFPNLPAATYNFKVVWGVSPSGTGTLLVGFRPRFSVWEI